MSLLLLFNQPAAAADTKAGSGSREIADPFPHNYYGSMLANVVADLAVKQTAKPAKEAKRARQLRRELARADVAWNGFYVDLLQQARSVALTEQIKAEYAQERIDVHALHRMLADVVTRRLADEDDAAVLLLL